MKESPLYWLLCFQYNGNRLKTVEGYCLLKSLQRLKCLSGQKIRVGL